MKFRSSLFFDNNDDVLLILVQEVLQQQCEDMRSLHGRNLHPQGIKELAANRSLRIAYATAHLLGTLETGTAIHRISALKALRNEVFFTQLRYYSKNTARVLIQIMKELVRSFQQPLEKNARLQLAHDFRMAFTSRPGFIRQQLLKYHLLEMPEDWNQYAFDNHVHDANSKGRKNPTHLILDAWIKGIRKLTIVYYNYLQQEAVGELLEAGEILDIQIQVAVEYPVRFREKYARIIWEPRGFTNSTDMLRFLQSEALNDFIEKGKEVSKYQQEYVVSVLKTFNSVHGKEFHEQTGADLPPLDMKEFIHFVGPGQPTLLHLASFIQRKLDRKTQTIPLKELIEHYLLPKCNPHLHDPSIPPVLENKTNLPALLQFDIPGLLHRLREMQPTSNFTLNIANLTPQDILEILYASGGTITHLEIYNLKNHSHYTRTSPTSCNPSESEDEGSERCLRHYFKLIEDLQQALSNDNAIRLKRAIRAIIWDYEQKFQDLRRQTSGGIDETAGLLKVKERKLDLLSILTSLNRFHAFYYEKALRSRIGSSSTGQAAEHYYGMGLIVTETLPARSRHQIKKELREGFRQNLPAQALLTRNCHTRFLDGKKIHWCNWSLNEIQINFTKEGNIATLGGRKGTRTDQKKTRKHRWIYLNSNLQNILKITIGFIPAFLTFMLTKDWWVLAWLGAPIWFGITALRNIIQSIFGGGGLRRSPLLPWNSFISWNRIADSLLFTGFSVPLLDWLVKTVLLANHMGVTTATNPILLYAVMGIANGIYISGHNIIRGLPNSAAAGNFFRSIFSIPVAILLNTLIGSILQGLAVPQIDSILQKWAAIISKFSSDCVAAIIEGLADRGSNIKARLEAYQQKISKMFKVYAELDLIFPDEDVLDMLNNPESLMETLNHKARTQKRLMIVNTLDLLYFWYYQPRAAKALRYLVRKMSKEEWLIFYRFQQILKCEKEISEVFIDGLLGKNFSKALAFYLANWEKYLVDLKNMQDAAT